MIYLQGMREVKRLIHPNGVFTIKLGRNAVSDRLVMWCGASSVFTYLLFLTIGMRLDGRRRPGLYYRICR